MIQSHIEKRRVSMEKISFDGRDIPVRVSAGCDRKMKVRCSLYGTDECPNKECSGFLVCPSAERHSDR